MKRDYSNVFNKSNQDNFGMYFEDELRDTSIKKNVPFDSNFILVQKKEIE